eukprot:TRINITY_DN4362_c0_g1_i1.p1 TRINITY_DN4362_c0_g1~~TRINITY_DN4362_c0_g1_i1.p1  ORF type:complete len:426 (-),score=52.83 TRINITY_DN4362_c0_g1_i1:455-1732(-)
MTLWRPTVLLLGDVGVGKSTLVERVTGITGISSDDSETCTKVSCAYVTKCRRMSIIDTPGSNAMGEVVQHNIWIASALNFLPVSLILIVVKADPRIDTTISNVRRYAECFQDLSDLLGVCVTHMDTVEWNPTKCLGRIATELGMTAVFVGKHTPAEMAIHDIMSDCKAAKNVEITCDNFPKMFKINNSNLRILKSVRDEVAKFQIMNNDFAEHLNDLAEHDKIDFVFEFQAFVSQELIEAQKRVGTAHGFSFVGPALANEVGHIANLTNQLRFVLSEVRTLALALSRGHGASDLRRCPHCGLVWAKVSGCNGATTCGSRPRTLDSPCTRFATFTFVWNGRRLVISKTSFRVWRQTDGAVASNWQGCGEVVNWGAMAPVSVPVEFLETEAASSTDDVQLIPALAQQAWRDFYSRAARGCNLTFVQA